VTSIRPASIFAISSRLSIISSSVRPAVTMFERYRSRLTSVLVERLGIAQATTLSHVRDLQQQLGEPDDRVQRRPQLVADVREELALELRAIRTARCSPRRARSSLTSIAALIARSCRLPLLRALRA
jgi:hypothetical protein